MDCVRTRATPLTSGREAARTQALLDQILESAGLPLGEDPGREWASHARIHAAGVLGRTPDPLATSTAEFADIMAINATASFTMTREAARVMQAQGESGSILLFSSVAAKEACRTDPYAPIR